MIGNKITTFAVNTAIFLTLQKYSPDFA